MKLYNLKAGTNPRRVRIFLAEKGIELPEVIEVDMMAGENKKPDYLAINPLGKMPALELDDGTIITESLAICRYFEVLHPEPALFGKTALEQAQVEMWNRRVELDIYSGIAGHFQHDNPFWKDRLKQVPEYAALCKEKAEENMKWLDEALAGRQFIAGDFYSVADITAQCALLLGKNTGLPVPEEYSNIHRWFSEVSSRPTARA